MPKADKVKRVAIIQSAYIPWKGFFDLVGRCDVYVIYDTAALRKRHWHSRNRIKRAHGSRWLSIPVKVAGRFGQPLQETVVSSSSWAEQHWSILRESYAAAPFFDAESPPLRELYEQLGREPMLSRINEAFIRWIAARLELTTQIVRDRDFAFAGDRNERLIQLCQAVGATNYLSGPGAREYLDVAAFERVGIAVEWITYGAYPEYDQPHGPFEHQVSILDTLFCCGPKSLKMLCPQTSATSQIKF